MSTKKMVLGFSLISKKKVLTEIGTPTKSIYFDTLGTLTKVEGNPSSYLTSKDSTILDQYIPNWKEQVKDYIIKRDLAGK
ncbi:MAG: hypothetical protein SNJ77_01930 [Cytophagales bacterium]